MLWREGDVPIVPIERKRLYPGDPVTIQVTMQGAVRVNGASVERDYGGCLLLYLDLHSKYAQVFGVGSGTGSGPKIYLEAAEQTLYLDESRPRNSITCVEFSDFVDWSIFCCDAQARYTLAVVLTAPDSEGLEHFSTGGKDECD